MNGPITPVAGVRNPPHYLRRGRAGVSFSPSQMRGVERRAAHRIVDVAAPRTANARNLNAGRAHHTPRLPALHMLRLFCDTAPCPALPRGRKPEPPASGCARPFRRTAPVPDFSRTTEDAGVSPPAPSGLRHSRTPHEASPRAGRLYIPNNRIFVKSFLWKIFACLTWKAKCGCPAQGRA